MHHAKYKREEFLLLTVDHVVVVSNGALLRFSAFCQQCILETTRMCAAVSSSCRD
jgi:hypothetical protein